MPTLAEVRAARAAAAAPALQLAPNDDMDELVRSFRRPVGGREAGAPALVEAGEPPAAGAPAPAALPPPPPARRHRPGRCERCDGPVVWVRTPLGAQPCEATPLRAQSRVETSARREREPSWLPGRELVLYLDDGEVVACNEDPDGPLVGRRSHHDACPAGRRRTT